MKILKNIQTAKTGILFLILGFIFSILFIMLLFLNHLTITKRNNVFLSFTEHSTYTIESHTNKKQKKQELFSYNQYHIYGYGIQNIFISFQNSRMNLKEILEKGLLDFDELLKNFQLINKSISDQILKYEYKEYIVTIANLYEDEIEVIFSLKG